MLKYARWTGLIVLIVFLSLRGGKSQENGNPLSASPPTAAAPSFTPPPAKAASKQSLLSVFNDGGPLMYPIAVCSFLTVIFIFERLITLRSSRVVPGPFVKKFLEQIKEGKLDRDEALERCKENGSPVALVFAAAVKKWGRTAVEVEQAIIDTGERVNNDLRKYLRVLNGVAQVGPLLGLLGTVLGMIVSFNSIADSSDVGQREMMAGGIAQALITTAAGMLVAIPALIAYLYFIGRIDRLVMDIDGYGQQLVELISSDGIAEREQSKGSRRSKAA